jgi:hypothetical protein
MRGTRFGHDRRAALVAYTLRRTPPGNFRQNESALTRNAVRALGKTIRQTSYRERYLRENLGATNAQPHPSPNREVLGAAQPVQRIAPDAVASKIELSALLFISSFQRNR